jgi:hypothetical protein
LDREAPAQEGRTQGVKQMNAKILGITLAVIAAPTAALAATETMDYSGSVMSITSESSFGGSGPGPFALNGWVELSSPLGANVTNDTMIPVAWSFSTPEGIVSSSFASNPTNVYGSVSASFTFTTRNGAIVGWNVVADSLYLPGGPTEVLSDITSDDMSGKGGDTYTGTVGNQYCGSVLCYSASAANSTPGEWSEVPEITIQSAAGGLSLLIGCLLILRGRRAT